MTTMSGSTRNSRLGLCAGLALTLPASLVLEGVGLWLALRPASHIAVGVLATIASGALLCLVGGVLMACSLLRQRRARAEATRDTAAIPRPRSAEEAAALAHAQKMEALGLLAGGVAHDFNNLLHVIRNSLEILERQGPHPDAHRSLEMIRRTTDQAAGLTRQLLAFSRRQPVELRPIDPNDLVAQVVELLRHSLGERITIETVLARGVWSIAADAGQLETALLNLAINARDAMSQAGRLTIETANAMLDDSFAAALTTRDPYVMIAVSDTGTGMPPEVAARACEPFFTTKEPGRGTGLGLSQVAGFARQAGGRVTISSEPGKGTTVRLYLPRSSAGGILEPSSMRGRIADASPSAVSTGPGGRPARNCGATRWPGWSIREADRDIPLAVGAASER